MKVKCRTGLVGLILIGILFASAWAEEQPTEEYGLFLSKGVEALKSKEDKKALRYFIIAQIFNPSSEKAGQYIESLYDRGIQLDPFSREDQLLGYQYYVTLGIEAYDNNQDAQAQKYFILAKIFDPNGPDPDRFLKQLRAPGRAPLTSLPDQRGPPAPMVQAARDVPDAVAGAVISTVPKAGVAGQTPVTAGTAVKGTTPLFVPRQKTAGPISRISFDDLVFTNGKASIRLELGTSVILEGKNFQRFLLTDDIYINVRMLGSTEIQIDALKIGSTFLHIWNDTGRKTIYVQVIFPKVDPKEQAQALGEEIPAVEHVRPFRFLYGADWSTYYFGEGTSSPDRQSLDFRQDFGIDGETPYGLLDASISTVRYNSPTRVITYTVGLTDIPLQGTTDFSLRAFDTRRYMSPLTLPGTLLRGASADVHFLDDLVGVSLSTGRKISSYGFISVGGSKLRSYIDAVQLTLFPDDLDHHYSINFARGYGSQHEPYLTEQVYSISGVHRIGDVVLGAEVAHDTSNTSLLSGFRWQKDAIRTGVAFRSIDKEYTTVVNDPPNQGEIGAVWSTEIMTDKVTAQTLLDVYRNYLYFNPDDPDALNYDASGNVRLSVAEDTWIETDAFYVDTRGEISPRRNLGISGRLAQYFDVWGGRKGTFYGGGTYQKSKYKLSQQSEFRRHSILAGVQVPLTSQLAAFANYEFSWLHEPFMGRDSNPNVTNTGLSYNKQFTEKFSVSSQLTFRKEDGVKGMGSYLAGQDSAGFSVGFAYNPKRDLSFYGDGGLRRVWAHLPGDQSYNDADVHFGMKLIFDVLPGIDPSGIVSGFVYKDRNGNNQYDMDEPGIPGITVRVGETETLTNADGKYTMLVKAKSVLVAPSAVALPAGFMFSSTGVTRVVIKHGRTQQVNFAMTSQTGVHGIVYIDKNGNETPDEGDQFLNRVRLILDGKEIEVSDSKGAYAFRNINEGAHTIAIDMSTLPINLIPRIKVKDKVIVAEGTTYIYHVPMALLPNPAEE